jgi:predicted PhzF superfamily epimerase YddE/YHI9
MTSVDRVNQLKKEFKKELKEYFKKNKLNVVELNEERVVVIVDSLEDIEEVNIDYEIVQRVNKSGNVLMAGYVNFEDSTDLEAADLAVILDLILSGEYKPVEK